jgi:hypothetical protein
MQSILITPKDQAELELLSALLDRLHIKTAFLDEETREDLGLGLLMQEANRTEQVSRETVFQLLREK